MSGSIAINYTGSSAILTHTLYVKWSQLTIEQIASGAAGLKTDLKGIIANQDNLEIISYLSTLLRAVALVG
jgi:hypothetical protein